LTDPTDEQLSDLLAGDDSDVASVTHVKQCDQCRAEIELLGSSVQHFNDLGMLWAEQNAPRRIPVPLNLEKANTDRLFQIRAEMTPDQIDRLERHR
jgi:hypothetical protein